MHRLEIDHWQRGGGRTLNVRWAPPAGESEPVGASRVFPTDPGVRGYLLATVVGTVGEPGADRLGRRRRDPVRANGLPGWWRERVCRAAAALTAGEVGSRLRAVSFPALLGPSQLLLFGAVDDAHDQSGRVPGAVSRLSHHAGSGCSDRSRACWRHSGSSCRRGGFGASSQCSARPAYCCGYREIC